MSQPKRKPAGKAAGKPARAKAGEGATPVLLELLAARGPSGYEQAPAAVWREAAGAFAQVSTDLVGLTGSPR